MIFKTYLSALFWKRLWARLGLYFVVISVSGGWKLKCLGFINKEPKVGTNKSTSKPETKLLGNNNG